MVRLYKYLKKAEEVPLSLNALQLEHGKYGWIYPVLIISYLNLLGFWLFTSILSNVMSARMILLCGGERGIIG